MSHVLTAFQDLCQLPSEGRPSFTAGLSHKPQWRETCLGNSPHADAFRVCAGSSCTQRGSTCNPRSPQEQDSFFFHIKISIAVMGWTLATFWAMLSPRIKILDLGIGI